MGVFTTIPHAPENPKPGQINQKQLEKFFQEGYLILENFFEKSELAIGLEQFEETVHNLATRLHKAKLITDPHKEADVFHRLTLLDQQHPGASVMLHQEKGYLPERLQKIFAHERVLNLMEQLVGPDVAGSAVWNVRHSVPGVQSHEVPWHQDGAYLTEEADNTLMIFAWIPFEDTDFHNGGIQLLRGGHRSEKIGQHKGCWKDTWYIWMENEDLEALGCDMKKDLVTCKVNFGDMLIFSNLMPHKSVPNQSDKVRWSVDFRYHDAKQPGGISKAPIILRKTGEENLKHDWDTFNSVDRHKLVYQEKDTFSTAINPEMWMRRWPLVHENKHTALYKHK